VQLVLPRCKNNSGNIEEVVLKYFDKYSKTTFTFSSTVVHYSTVVWAYNCSVGLQWTPGIVSLKHGCLILRSRRKRKKTVLESAEFIDASCTAKSDPIKKSILNRRNV
jgi:hypothetical protein